MAVANLVELSKPAKPRWYTPTSAKFFFAVLVMQGVLFLSAHDRWFWFNEQKGYTVLITVAATAIALLLLVGLVIVSWFFRSKAQFSIATLLLMVCVMALPCGWLAREMSLAREQHRIIASLDARAEPRIVYCDETSIYVGGRVVSRPKPPYPYEVLERTFGHDFVSDISQISLWKGDGAEIAKLRGLRRLKTLWLEGREVNDAGLSHLKDLPDLEDLSLDGTVVTDAGLIQLLRVPNLKYLELYGNPCITDAGLAHLQDLPQLRELLVRGRSVTDDSLAHLGRLSKLEYLGVYSSHRVTDAGLPHLSGMHQLKKLELDGTRISGEGLEHLRPLSQLEELSVMNTDVTLEEARLLKQYLPSCKIHYGLRGCMPVAGGEPTL